MINKINYYFDVAITGNVKDRYGDKFGNYYNLLSPEKKQLYIKEYSQLVVM